MAGLSAATATGEEPLVAPARRGAACVRVTRAAIVLFAVALVVRLVVVVATPHYALQSDAADFDRIAVTLSQEGRFPSSVLATSGPTAFRPPLFPIALSAAYDISGTGSKSARWEAGRILEAALGALAVVLVYLIGLRLWTARVAITAGAMATVYPPLIIVGVSLMSEPLFIVFLLGAVLSALASRTATGRRRWGCAVGAGVLTGCAALTRSNGIVLLLPILLLVWRERPRLSLRAARAPLMVLAAAIVTLMPYTIRNAIVFHKFIPVSTQTGYALAGTYNSYSRYHTPFPGSWLPPVPQVLGVLARDPRANEAQIGDRLTTEATSYIDAHPGYVATVAYWNTLRLLSLPGPGYERAIAQSEGYPMGLVSVSVYAFWFVALLALGGVLLGAARRTPIALWACAVVILIPSAIVSGTMRYRSPADPFVILLAALALTKLWSRTAGVARSGPQRSA